MSELACVHQLPSRDPACQTRDKLSLTCRAQHDAIAASGAGARNNRYSMRNMHPHTHTALCVSLAPAWRTCESRFYTYTFVFFIRDNARAARTWSCRARSDKENQLACDERRQAHKPASRARLTAGKFPSLRAPKIGTPLCAKCERARAGRASRAPAAPTTM